MNCEGIMELMQRYLDHDLADAEQEALFAHLQGCPVCAASFEQLQILSNELSSLTKVMPPFSIVDSILPRLDEIDAEAAGIEAAYLAPIHRTPTRFFSWRIALGFAAAAIILSVFAVNLTPTSKYDAGQKMSATSRSSNAANDTDKETAGGSAEVPQAAPAPKAEPSAKVDAAAKTEDTMTPMIVFGQSSGEASNNNGAKEYKVQFPTPSPKASAAATPAPTHEAAAKTINHADVMFAPALNASPAATPAPATKPTASPAGDYSAMTKQNAAFAANSPSTNQLKSDDGQFIGMVENQTVIISTPDKNRVYTSLIQWKSSDTIQLLRWLDNMTLSYQVTMEDGRIKHYVIDPILKTEQEQ